MLTSEHTENLMKRGFTRRNLGKIAAMVTGGAAFSFYNEPALAQLSAVRNIPADAVKINSNENPMGPCPEAMEAIYSVVKKGGRYVYEETFGFQEVMASQEGLQAKYVQPFAGSSAPLHQAVLAFTSPTRSFVTASPGYEAGERAAKFIGSKVIKVPLTSGYAHDVKAMAKADPNAGIIYICNPNNPTGTLTPREDIEWLLANKPKDTLVLLDEAYIHLSDAQMGSDLVAKDKDVIVLRTFSKLYGMAGLRAGAALGRPDLLEKMTPYSSGALPATGMAGATASLKVKNLVPERRKAIKAVRDDVFEFLEAKKFAYVPSVSNKFMVDVKRPGAEVIEAMRLEKVYIGRTWQAWPTHVRVSVGTKEEMDKFKTAFLKVMS